MLRKLFFTGLLALAVTFSFAGTNAQVHTTPGSAACQAGFTVGGAVAGGAFGGGLGSIAGGAAGAAIGAAVCH